VLHHSQFTTVMRVNESEFLLGYHKSTAQYTMLYITMLPVTLLTRLFHLKTCLHLPLLTLKIATFVVWTLPCLMFSVREICFGHTISTMLQQILASPSASPALVSVNMAFDQYSAGTLFVPDLLGILATGKSRTLFIYLSEICNPLGNMDRQHVNGSF